jgi:hypothetical protein
MHWARRVTIALSLVAVLASLSASLFAQAQEKPKPLIIPLAPYGMPKNLFSMNRTLSCFHLHSAGTRLFWLDADHIFVAFTTNPPCTFKSGSDEAGLRAIVFDKSGTKIASRDWPLEGSFTLFAGPDHMIVLWKGSRLDLLDDHLQTVESGELAARPKGLYVTPARRTIPLLSADGHNFEFYGVNPLKLLTTIAVDQSTEINAVEDWTPGDERVAGTHCKDKSAFTCSKIFVLTADANFLQRDGAPWSYEEVEKPVMLEPVGFLDSTHLVISRQEKGLFHGPQAFIVRPDGSKTLLPNPGGPFNIRDIAGIAADGSRFGLEYIAVADCPDCIAARRFVVEEIDSKKFLFEKYGSPYFSHFELSPDGKSAAVLDDGVIGIYPLPGRD